MVTNKIHKKVDYNVLDNKYKYNSRSVVSVWVQNVRTGSPLWTACTITTAPYSLSLSLSHQSKV